MGEGIRIGGGGKKEGQYVWKKLTANGGDFIDFVVSDQSTAYPDGGEQGGYWYEKMEQYAFGYSKVETGNFVITSDSQTADISHGLGEVPKAAYLMTTENLLGQAYHKSLTAFTRTQVGNYNMDAALLMGHPTWPTIYNNGSSAMLATDKMITFKTQNTTFPLKAGITYHYMLLA